MYEISRRNLILSSAAAAAVFGLDGKVAMIDSAFAQKAPFAPFARFKVGDFTVTTISDGEWNRDHDAGFIKNATIDDTKKALKAAGLPEDKVTIPFTVTVVDTGKGLVMFDAGTGAQLAPTAGKMADNMKAAGIDPAKIETIVVTHFHPDHIFGLMAKDTNAQLFPKAKVIVPEAEYKFWTDPGLIAKLPPARQGLAKRVQAVFPSWKEKGVVSMVASGKDVMAGITSVDSAGHTPGHTSYLVASGGKQLMVLGDVSNIPALFVRNPGWHAAFDQDATKAEATRRAMYDRVIADKVTVSGYHFGMPGAGTIEKDGAGYAFVPVKV